MFGATRQGECYCAVRVTVRRRWYDIVMLSSCALSEGVPGVRFFTLFSVETASEADMEADERSRRASHT